MPCAKKYKITDEEQALWERYRKTRCESLRNRLIEIYMPLVRRLAAYQFRKMAVNSVVSFDDLMSYGSFGLIRAVERFDPSKGFTFATYGSRRINGAMLDGLRQTDWVPRNEREKQKRGESVPTEMECMGEFDAGETCSVLDHLADDESVALFWEEMARHFENETDRTIFVRHFRDGADARTIAGEVPAAESMAAINRRCNELLEILREKLSPKTSLR